MNIRLRKFVRVQFDIARHELLQKFKNGTTVFHNRVAWRNSLWHQLCANPSNVFILQRIALSEKQIPRFVGNVSS